MNLQTFFGLSIPPIPPLEQQAWTPLSEVGEHDLNVGVGGLVCTGVHWGVLVGVFVCWQIGGFAGQVVWTI